MSFCWKIGKVLRTKEDYEASEGTDLTCWRADEWLHFGHSGGMSSINFPYFSLERFAAFLEKAIHTTNYLDFGDENLSISLEEEDEGTRNFIASTNGLVLIYNLQASYFPAFIEYLREECMKKDEEAVNQLKELRMKRDFDRSG